MGVEELKSAVQKLIDGGIKKSQIETELGMPQNSLSGMLSGTKSMPEKWEKRLNEWIIKEKNHPVNVLLRNDANLPPANDELAKKIDAAPAKKELPTKLVVTDKGLKEKPSDEKLSAMKLAIDKINKDFGAGSVMCLGDKETVAVDVISTGSIGLDIALGVMGLPRGRIVEIYGPESSGKTTLAIHVIAEAQKLGLLCAIVDVEHAFDPIYAENLGVKMDKLQFCQPDYGEQALEIADRLINTGSFGVVLVDSVAALVPKGELESEMGSSKMGLHARLMSQACRKMTHSISKTNTLCIFINQLRSMIGVMMGNPEITTGGNALKFYSSVRLDVRRSLSADNSIMEDGVKVGNLTTVKVIKNKVAPPFKKAEFDIIYGEGISYMGEIVDLGTEHGIINKSGSWYAYDGSKLGQGRQSVIDLLKDHPDMAEKIKNEVLAKINAA